MVEYISKADAVFAACRVLDKFGGCHMGPFCPDSGCKEVREIFEDIPVADVVEVVRCRDCKHRIVNEHCGEKGYMKLKAMCELDTGDPFELGRYAEEDDWFCADGEPKGGGQEPPEEVLSGPKE